MPRLPLVLPPLSESRDGLASGSLRGLLELLDLSRDGHPRQLTLVARSSVDVDRLTPHVMAIAGNRGYVPLTLDSYDAIRTAQPERLRDRTLLLVAAPGASSGRAAAALLNAAAGCQRAHLLLMMQVQRSGSVIREARARYGGQTTLRQVPVVDREVTGQLQRALRAGPLVAAGRHAAAIRLLRDVAGWMKRRTRPLETARLLLELGRILMERGRAGDADHAFDDAATAALQAGEQRLHVDARIWQAVARTDAGRLTEAESICRAVLACPSPNQAVRAHACAVLGRVLIWQHRSHEALDFELAGSAGEGEQMDVATACFVAGTRVRLLLTAHRVFDAGVEARRLLDRTEGDRGLARLIALTSHLRVLTAAGDLALAESCVTDIVGLARRLRTPLRAVRARALLTAAQHRAAAGDARALDARRVRRLAAAGPPLLRRAVEELTMPPPGVHAAGLSTAAAIADIPHLICLAHDADKDEDAALKVLAAVAATLTATRVDLWCDDAGTPAVVMSVGNGLVTQLGVRIFELGMAIGPEVKDCGRELGVPVGKGARMSGAVVARWAADITPPSTARALLETAAAIVHPRLEALRTVTRLTAEASLTVPELVGVSEAMRDLRAAIARAAAAPFTVLIHGESGVGKELAARAIHSLSPRRQRAFTDVNCAALPDELLESELFGHARGAFTGAVAERAGLFEAADGGTVFLDEIADLSPRGQAKLLRVLQQREVRRIGEAFSRPVDVRLVTAANRDVSEEVTAGRFRADLLYRLDVIRLKIPALRERPEDVAPLTQHFWSEAARRVGTTATLAHGVLTALTRYHWPGNVRELQNVMSALAVAAPARGQVRAHLLPAAIMRATSTAASRLADARIQFERRVIESALARHTGNRSRAARELGLSRQGLLKMMVRLGLR